MLSSPHGTTSWLRARHWSAHRSVNKVRPRLRKLAGSKEYNRNARSLLGSRFAAPGDSWPYPLAIAAVCLIESAPSR